MKLKLFLVTAYLKLKVFYVVVANVNRAPSILIKVIEVYLKMKHLLRTLNTPTQIQTMM